MTRTKISLFAVPVIAAIMIGATIMPASAGFEGLIVSVDIKPNSCPNVINAHSNGVLPIAILGTEDFDVNEIDLASLNIPFVKANIEDVATPFDGVPTDQFTCTTEGSDGFDDLVIKISMDDILCLDDGVVGVLVVTGELLDGTEFSGEDYAVAITKKPCPDLT